MDCINCIHDFCGMFKSVQKWNYRTFVRNCYIPPSTAKSFQTVYSFPNSFRFYMNRNISRVYQVFFKPNVAVGDWLWRTWFRWCLL